MAIFSASLSSYALSRKVVLTSTCVLSIAMALKISLPVLTNLTFSELPVLYNLAISCLKPPYLYLFINFIIVTIVASSKVQNGDSTEFVSSPELVSSTASENVAGELRPGVLAAEDYDVVVYGGDIVSGAEIKDEEVVKSKKLVKQDSVEFSGSSEKPPVSVRLGHRKFVKSSPEAGKSLRVSKPKRQDTLESTWKTITEGRPIPLTRHLRKSDTWETRNNPLQNQPTTNTEHKMKKSETFQDRTIDNYPSLGPGKSLRKEPSLGQEELNRRVEAFIKKFNEDMRLQRQESLDQYQEMIKRGTI